MLDLLSYIFKPIIHNWYCVEIMYQMVLAAVHIEHIQYGAKYKAVQ